ncbi:MAG: preprotein translocase subunit SecE [Candidatus Omnitrophota bacterium]
MNKVVNFFKEIKVEMKKVSWSSRQELIDSTLVVIIAVFMLAVFIGACDFFISKIMRLIIG